MPKYHVVGRDDSTDQEQSMAVEQLNVEEAAQFAATRGLRPVLIRDSNSVEYRATANGWQPVAPVSSPVTQQVPESGSSSEKALLLLSFLIPPIGIIAGAIRLAARDSSGIRIVLSAIAGAVIGALLIGSAIAKSERAASARETERLIQETDQFIEDLSRDLSR